MTSKGLRDVAIHTALNSGMNGGEEEEPDTFLSSAFELDAPSYEAEHDVNIGPLSLAGGVYTHKGPNCSIHVQDQPEKVSN